MFRVTPTKCGDFTIETKLDMEQLTDHTGTTSFIPCQRDQFLALLREGFQYMTSDELSELSHDAFCEVLDRDLKRKAFK